MQQTTIDTREIPDHYVPLTKYGGTRTTRSGKRVENWEYRCLRAAWHAGELDGIKLLRTPTDDKGHVYVDPTVAEATISQARAKKAASLNADARAVRGVIEHTGKFDRVLVDAPLLAAFNTLLEIASGLQSGQAALVSEIRRLADAAELLATQPKTPQQELLHTINGNPASWNET